MCSLSGCRLASSHSRLEKGLRSRERLQAEHPLVSELVPSTGPDGGVEGGWGRVIVSGAQPRGVRMGSSV